jgi:hypothetical protein
MDSVLDAMPLSSNSSMAAVEWLVASISLMEHAKLVMHLLDSNFQMVSARFLAAAISTKEDV